MKAILLCGALGITLAAAQSDNIPVPGEDGFPLNTLLPCETQNQGWGLLFDGQSRAGFAGNFADWKSGNDTNTQVDPGWTYSAADSAIQATVGTTTDIRTRQSYEDFDLRFSYRNNGQSGVYYKALTRGDFIWQSGVEYGIDEDQAGTSLHSSGSVYDLFGPPLAVSKTYRKYATGAWNSVRIVVKGDSVEHWMNNVKLAGYRFWNDRWNAALSPSKFRGMPDFAQETPGCECAIRKGYIALQGSDGFENLLIRNLRITGKAGAVQLGQVGCPTADPGTTGLGGEGISQGRFSLERGSGELLLRWKQGTVTRAEVFGQDGKRAARAVVSGGATVSISGWSRPGVYLLRLRTREGSWTGKVALF